MRKEKKNSAIMCIFANCMCVCVKQKKNIDVRASLLTRQTNDVNSSKVSLWCCVIYFATSKTGSTRLLNFSTSLYLFFLYIFYILYVIGINFNNVPDELDGAKKKNGNHTIISLAKMFVFA
jgi:hypothetical protein